MSEIELKKIKAKIFLLKEEVFNVDRDWPLWQIQHHLSDNINQIYKLSSDVEDLKAFNKYIQMVINNELKYYLGRKKATKQNLTDVLTPFRECFSIWI